MQSTSCSLEEVETEGDWRECRISIALRGMRQVERVGWRESGDDEVRGGS